MYYRQSFRKYLDDLGKRKPSPGGGSAVCLVFCAGISLMEKAINYSLPLTLKNSSAKLRKGKLKKGLDKLNALRKKVYLYIDKDGELFEKIMREKGSKKAKFIKESEDLIVCVAQACKEVFFLAKGIESGIKKNIVSDFDIGLEFVRSAFSGCIMNLEANAKMFGRRNRHIKIFRKYLRGV